MEIKNQVGDIGNKLDRIHDNSLPLIMERRLACASYSRKTKKYTTKLCTMQHKMFKVENLNEG